MDFTLLNFKHLALVALVWTVFWTYLGIKYANRRILWASADVAALLVGTATVGFLGYSVIEDLERGRAAAMRSVEELLRWELHHSSASLHDKYCDGERQAAATRTPAPDRVCDFSKKLARELIAPKFNYFNSRRLHDEGATLCGESCSDELASVVNKLKRHSDFYLDRRDALEESDGSSVEKLRWKVGVLGLFIIAFGPRWGRSIAELTREGAFGRIIMLLRRVLSVRGA